MISVLFKKEMPKNGVKVIPTATTNLKSKHLSLNEKKVISNAMKQADFKLEEGNVLEVLGLENPILIIAVSKKMNHLSFEKIGAKLVPYLKNKNMTYFVSGEFSLTDIEEAHAVASGLILASYKFDKYCTKDKGKDVQGETTFVLENATKAKASFKNKQAILESVFLARDLSSEPANNLTPLIFSKKIKELEKTGVEVEILGLKELKDKKFGMLLSVAQGSQNEPKVAIMKWIGNPNKKEFDIGFVGKGVTFDSGGISLKPSTGMGDMKQDMTGAGVVVSSMQSFAHRKVKSNVIGIVGLVENMPSGSATRPGDVVVSMSGQTVEILNTDAEGRLVLGDCLWYLQSNYPVKKIVDLATLTGAVMATLGEEYAGLFTPDNTLCQEIIDAGQKVGEEVWRLPINKFYDKMLDSDIADMKNIGGRLAGGSTAACFLNRFIKKGTKWAHLDIAGVDKYEKSKPTTPKGATGWGVRLLNELVK